MTTRSSLALPHLALQASDVKCDPADGWRVTDLSSTSLGAILRDGDLVESWDASRPLDLVRTVTLPSDTAMRLGLDPGTARFALLVVGTTGRGMYSTVLCRVDVTGPGPYQLQVRPRGDHLLRDLQLSTAVVLVDAGTSPSSLAPSARGSRIWEDLTRFQLEGGRARLPIEVLSFRSTAAFRDFQDALFHVHVAGDGDLEIEQGLLVHLNSDHPGFVSRVVTREPMATAVLWDGIVRQVLREAIAQDLTPGESATGTLGATASRWMELAFAGRGVDEITNLAGERPADFDAIVESWTGAVRRLFSSVDGA